ncbi:MAG TPA: fumarate reductase flavoprotein subunit, partial [Pseudodesulfovibrio sp.]|nr:fumarate reductase flavoprotein subunit [Pseudodesulfovibrio sp.]
AAMKLEGQVKLAMCIAQAALMRTESRGSHNREDFPARNDAEWLNRTLAYWPEGADMPDLKYEDTTPLFELPPGDRGYGGGKIIPADDKYVKERTVKSPVTEIGKKK